MSKLRVCIVSPALADANNGNWHTARRWQRFLAPLAEVRIDTQWKGEADVLIALHARRSADSIVRFAQQHPDRPLAVVLTGTDLYRDLANGDARARHSVQCASQIVVLQPEALHRLDPHVQVRARVILQSATRVVRHDRSMRSFDFVAVGHLRDVKDPLTLMQAACTLPPSPARVVHIGGALDEALAQAARETMAHCPRYRWLGALSQHAARRWIARARALVHTSRMEGGANVVIEAVRSCVPVLASRIDGNVGLLGRDYEGYFEPGDASALAELMQRFASDTAFARRLAAQCAAREPLFAPQMEAAQVRRMLADMVGTPLTKSPHERRELHTSLR